MYQLGKLYSLINEKSREDEEKVELMVSICLIASCFAGFWELFWKFQRFQLLFFQNFSSFWAGLGSCFRDFSSFSYFFLEFFQLLGWFRELFWEFQRFQLLF